MFKIGIVSQKGGVGKSTIAREVTKRFTGWGWRVKLADLDVAQTTSVDWNRRRLKSEIEPALSVEGYPSVKHALLVKGFNLLVFDAKPHSNAETLAIAKACDLVVLPTGTTVDDLTPQVRLAQELKREGIEPRRMLFVLNSVLTSAAAAETENAVGMIRAAGFDALDEIIPRRPSLASAQNFGRTISEITHPGLRDMIETVGDRIAERLKALTSQEAA